MDSNDTNNNIIIETDTMNNTPESTISSTTTPSIGHYKIGFAQDKNKDAHSYFTDFDGKKDQGWFAVYDGHAGKSAAEYCGEQLHNTFITQLKDSKDPLEALYKTFIETDQQITIKKTIYSGCCAVCCFVRVEPRFDTLKERMVKKRVVYSANAGDARAIVSKGGVAVRLTYDHKGSDETEAKRVSEAGGFVLKDRVNGVLAVTRSLGDITLKEWVIGAPFTSELVLEDADEWLVIACDGVWDVMTDQEVVDLIKSKDEQCAADDVLEMSLEKFSKDNLSVICVKIAPVIQDDEEDKQNGE